MALKIGSTTVVDNSSDWQGTALATSAIADSAITREKMGFSANYAVANTVSIVVDTTNPTTVASVSLTTTGRPVMLMGCADMNVNSSGYVNATGFYTATGSIAVNNGTTSNFYTFPGSVIGVLSLVVNSSDGTWASRMWSVTKNSSAKQEVTEMATAGTTPIIQKDATNPTTQRAQINNNTGGNKTFTWVVTWLSITPWP